MLLDLLSALGPAQPPPAPIAPVFSPVRQRRPRATLRVRVTITGRGHLADNGTKSVTVRASAMAGRSLSRGSRRLDAAGTVRARSASGALRSTSTIRRLVRTTDHRHLTLPLPVLDLLLESWDS